MVDPVLTGIAHGYSNEAFVGSKIYPLVGVEKEKGNIPKWGKESFVARTNTRSLRGPSNRIPPTDVDKVQYQLIEHDVEIALDKRELSEASSELKYETRTTKELQDLLELEREKAIADHVQNPLVITQTTAKLAGASWVNDDDKDVIADIISGREAIRSAIGVYPNVAIISANVYNVLLYHQNIVDKVAYSGMAKVTKAILAELFEIPNIYIGKGSYASDSDEADSLTALWTDTMLLAYVDQADSQTRSEYAPSFGYTLQKKGKPTIDTYEENGGKIKVIRNTDMYDILDIQKNCAYLFTSCLA
jgi:hypothetical protein